MHTIQDVGTFGQTLRTNMRYALYTLSDILIFEGNLSCFQVSATSNVDSEENNV